MLNKVYVSNQVYVCKDGARKEELNDEAHPVQYIEIVHILKLAFIKGTVSRYL